MTNQDFLNELNFIHARWEKLIEEQDFALSLDFLSLQSQRFSDDSSFARQIKGRIAFYRGSTYSRMENYEAALLSFEESYRLDPEDSVLFCKATICWMLGRTSQAEGIVSSIREPVIVNLANAWLERRKSS